MPTVPELQQLAGLVKQLAPLANKERGELIRAQEWNTLVGAVIEVAGAVLARDKQNVVPPHEHVEQVTLAWLDPRLRALVERGPLTDPAAVSRVTQIEQRVTGFSNRIEELNGSLQQVKDNVTKVSANDLKRESDITTVQRTMGGLADSRQEVLAVRETLQSVQRDVQAAIKVGSNLTINGQPANLQALADRVNGVERLTTGLTSPTGQVFTAAGLEQRLTQLTNTVVTQEQLDNTLRTRPVQISPEQIQAVQDKVKSDLKTDFDTAATKLGSDIRNETTQRLAQVDSLISRSVSDALPAVKDAVLGTIRPEITAAVGKSAAESQAFTEKRVNETSSALLANVGKQITDTQASITPAVKAEFDRQVPATLGAIQTDLASLKGRLGATEGRLTDDEARLTAVGSRAEVIAREAATGQTQVKQELTSEMDRRDQQRTADLNTRFTQVDAAILQKLDTKVSDVRTELLQQVNKAASDAAASEVRLATNQLRGEMRAVAKDELSAVHHELPQIIRSHVQDAFSGVPGLVNREVLRQTGNLERITPP